MNEIFIMVKNELRARKTHRHTPFCLQTLCRLNFNWQQIYALRGLMKWEKLRSARQLHLLLERTTRKLKNKFHFDVLKTGTNFKSHENFLYRQIKNRIFPTAEIIQTKDYYNSSPWFQQNKFCLSIFCSNKYN